MGVRQFNEKHNETVQVEIQSELLAQLITSGLLPGNECKCLDNNARKTLWKSLLNVNLKG